MTGRSSIFLAGALLALSGCSSCRETPTPGGAATSHTAAPVVTTAPASAAPSATSSAAPSASASAAPSASASADAAAGPPKTFAFDADKADEPPAGLSFFATGGKPGKWLVKAVPGAPSGPNVLAQLDTDRADARFTVAIASEPSLRDVKVSVRCKPIAGKVDQSCGVVARFKDEKNYYLARANALEKDVNLYVVKDGKRASLGGWKGATFGDAWHEIQLVCRGDHLEVNWDGTRIYEAADKTFADPGKAGVWVKADSVTYFDELTVTPLAPPRG